MSKYQFQQSDIYQLGTDLPVNLPCITDADLLHEVEAQLLGETSIHCVQNTDCRLLQTLIGAGLSRDEATP